MEVVTIDMKNSNPFDLKNSNPFKDLAHDGLNWGNKIHVTNPNIVETRL